jgi:hypothetical protein
MDLTHCETWRSSLNISCLSSRSSNFLRAGFGVRHSHRNRRPSPPHQRPTNDDNDTEQCAARRGDNTKSVDAPPGLTVRIRLRSRIGRQEVFTRSQQAHIVNLRRDAQLDNDVKVVFFKYSSPDRRLPHDRPARHRDKNPEQRYGPPAARIKNANWSTSILSRAWHECRESVISDGRWRRGSVNPAVSNAREQARVVPAHRQGHSRHLECPALALVPVERERRAGQHERVAAAQSAGRGRVGQACGRTAMREEGGAAGRARLADTRGRIEGAREREYCARGQRCWLCEDEGGQGDEAHEEGGRDEAERTARWRLSKVGRRWREVH